MVTKIFPKKLFLGMSVFCCRGVLILSCQSSLHVTLPRLRPYLLCCSIMTGLFSHVSVPQGGPRFGGPISQSKAAVQAMLRARQPGTSPGYGGGGGMSGGGGGGAGGQQPPQGFSSLQMIQKQRHQEFLRQQIQVRQRMQQSQAGHMPPDVYGGGQPQYGGPQPTNPLHHMPSQGKYTAHLPPYTTCPPRVSTQPTNPLHHMPSQGKYPAHLPLTPHALTG